MSIPINPHISVVTIGISSAIPIDFYRAIQVAGTQISTEAEVSLSKISGASLAIFIIDAQIGIDKNLVDYWDECRARQLPRLILVAGLSEGEIDFDDIVLIANRILDPVITPYLVLHGEDGKPNGVINIETSQTYDYSQKPPKVEMAGADLRNLVSEFAVEYLEQLEEFGSAGFIDGLIFPCIPYIPALGIGLNEARSYIELIPKL